MFRAAGFIKFRGSFDARQRSKKMFVQFCGSSGFGGHSEQRGSLSCVAPVRLDSVRNTHVCYSAHCGATEHACDTSVP